MNAHGRLYWQGYLQFHQSSPYVYLVFSFPSLVCTNKHRCCLVYRVNFQLMCPLATGIGTVHIKFEDVNICLWYSCVLIVNTQFNSSVSMWDGIKIPSLDETISFFNSGLCEIVVILKQYSYHSLSKNIKM